MGPGVGMCSVWIRGGWVQEWGCAEPGVWISSRDVQNLGGLGGSRNFGTKQPLFMHPSSQYFAGGGRERTLLVLTCVHH